MPKKKTFEEVRAAFNQRGFMLVSKEYKNSYSSLKYLCSNGHQTKISFAKLQSGNGCLECSGKKKKTIEEVREIFTTRNYTLLSTEYKNSSSPLNYICDNGHQTKIRLAELQSGRGCSSCAEHGFNPNKSATLYYIRFQYEGNSYYKIGITNRSISERFQSERTAYTVLKETTYTMGKDAHTQEQAILKKFSAYRYKGKPFLVQGNTELFTRDVLYIDNSVLVTC